jgi:serine/threonine protein kinase
LKLIASGTSGAVYLARVKSTSELVAIKVIKKEGRSDTHLQFAVREQQVQNAVMGDDKFTTLVASWHDQNNFYIVTVYPLQLLCDKSSLMFIYAHRNIALEVTWPSNLFDARSLMLLAPNFMPPRW